VPNIPNSDEIPSPTRKTVAVRAKSSRSTGMPAKWSIAAKDRTVANAERAARQPAVER
jgi:hypothetical protein